VTSISFQRIRSSFARLSPHDDRFATLVYEHLFAVCPETRALFEIDLRAQGRHFASAIALIVRNLDVLDALEQPLRELGAAHARAGVRPHHYPAVCQAVLRAVEMTLGDAWSEQLASDWRWLLETVAQHMIAGAIERRM
jgi:nitric oxide dioxygenase